MSKGYSGLSGRGGSSGIGAISEKQVDSVMNPTTKTEFVEKLEVLAEIGQAGYETVAKTTEWEKYGKSRTYLKVDAYRESDGRFHHSFDYGYFDNVSGSYVASTRNDLYSANYDLGGNNKITVSDVVEALKKKKKK